jgi:hypothetical protein
VAIDDEADMVDDIIASGLIGPTVATRRPGVR